LNCLLGTPGKGRCKSGRKFTNFCSNCEAPFIQIVR